MKTYLHHPREGFSGPVTINRRTVTFVDGVAVLEDGPVTAWRRAGYLPSTSPGRSEDQTFDPADATVREVVRRLHDPETTDVERERILSSERTGKARKTILSWTAPTADDVTEEDPGGPDSDA